MIDMAKQFGATVMFAALGVVLILLGWQGLIGKGLAAFLAPGALEVIGGTDTSGSNTADATGTTSHSN